MGFNDMGLSLNTAFPMVTRTSPRRSDMDAGSCTVWPASYGEEIAIVVVANGKQIEREERLNGRLRQF